MKHLGMLRAGAFAFAIAASTAGTAGTGHQWGDYRWNTNGVKGANALALNVRYKFENTNYWLPYYLNSVSGGLTGALRKWDVGTSTYASPLALTDRGEASGKTSLGCEFTPGEVLVCADFYGTNEGWVGIAEIDIDANNYIAWATAKFNDSYYRSAPYSTTYNTDAQKQFVACHEIGHTFGLGHLDTAFYNPNKGSCMDYTADPDGGGRNKDNRSPGDVDWQVLLSNTMYGTLTSSGGKGGGKPGRLDPFQFREVGSSSPQGLANGRFGRIAAYDDLGRPVEYFRDLPNGHTRLIFVTWAKGHRPSDSR